MKTATHFVSTLAAAAAPFLTRGVDLDDLLRALVDTVVQSVEADRGTLYLLDSSRQKLTSIIAHLPEIPRIELDLGQGIAGAVAVDGVVRNVHNSRDDPHFDSSVDAQTGYRTESMLVVPIRDAGEGIIGVLQLLNAKKGQFTEDDAKTAQRLGTEAGRILERTSLYAALKKHRHVGHHSVPPRKELSYRFNHIVGDSPAMQHIYRLVEKAAVTDASVLITGESGTGKELIARAVHANSLRRDGPFIKVDCTTLPESLIDNELFGHERGAFTGADRTSVGKIEAAHRGTLFIDEIGELPLRLQGKLLRLLQDKTIMRVGGTKTIDVDIRIVCATHRNLATMVDDGLFREDLYYRVRVVPIHLPALRERPQSDLLHLLEHFVDKYARRYNRPFLQLSDEALHSLLQHTYPGNIRELEHCIESAVVLCDGNIIEQSDLPMPARTGRREINPETTPSTQSAPVLAAPQSAQAEHTTQATQSAQATHTTHTTQVHAVPVVGDPHVSLADLERAHIHLVLAACHGNQSEAARRLGIGRNTLLRRLYGASSASPDEP